MQAAANTGLPRGRGRCTGPAPGRRGDAQAGLGLFIASPVSHPIQLKTPNTAIRGLPIMRQPRQRSTGLARSLRKQMTHAEVKLWLRLRSRQLRGQKFRRQHPIGPYIVDFACLNLKLAIEVDGPSHTTGSRIAHDRERTAFLEQGGWQVLRFWNTDIHQDMEACLECIARALQVRETHRRARRHAVKDSQTVSWSGAARPPSAPTRFFLHHPPQSSPPAGALTAPPSTGEPDPASQTFHDRFNSKPTGGAF